MIDDGFVYDDGLNLPLATDTDESGIAIMRHWLVRPTDFKSRCAAMRTI